MQFKQNSSFVRQPRPQNEEEQAGSTGFGRFAQAHRLIDTKNMQKNLASAVAAQQALAGQTMMTESGHIVAIVDLKDVDIRK